MDSFFLLRAPTHHSFTFNLRFLYELTHKVHLSKKLRGIFHFRFCFVFFNKNMDSLTLKRHNSFQNCNNRKTMHIFAPRYRRTSWRAGGSCPPQKKEKRKTKKWTFSGKILTQLANISHEFYIYKGILLDD